MPLPPRIKEFRRVVRAHYRRHRRSMPWRDTRDPYRILVSEVMLQQTQVDRVRPFYAAFLKRFATPRALAAAPLGEVLRAWQGLGYNRRAKFLHAAAQQMSAEHGGRVPRNEASLVTLPGIGPNTAGAIRAYAFNEPAVFIETNIRRAFIHHFFPRAVQVSDARILPLVEQALDRRDPREWYYALMDYGAALGRDAKIANPNLRSKTYRKQSAFEGSVRKLRGEVLRMLLRGETIGRADRVRLAPALRALEKEAFIRKNGNGFRVI